MGCISDCQYRAVCAIAADSTGNAVDWANYGFGAAAGHECHVQYYCGPAGAYQMFTPLYPTSACCAGCVRDCSGVGGSLYDPIDGACRNKQL